MSTEKVCSKHGIGFFKACPFCTIENYTTPKNDMKLQIDYLPSIKAFAEQRIDTVQKSNMEAYEKISRLQELHAIVGLCDSFLSQKDLLEGAFK